MYWGVFTVSIIACFKRIMCPNFTKNVEKSCAYLQYKYLLVCKIGKKIDKKVFKMDISIVFAYFISMI